MSSNDARPDGSSQQENPFLDRDFFDGEVFFGVALSGADLAQKEFARCTFKQLTLVESDWGGARLDDCLFEDCDLTRMRPAKMAARGVVFLNCRLPGSVWADLRPTPALSFERCNLQYASFVGVNLTGAPFTHCRLTEVNFFESRLVDADFTGSDLTGSRFEDCDARGANLANTRGLFIDPAKNKIQGARIDVETAVLIALASGFRVSGYDEDR